MPLRLRSANARRISPAATLKLGLLSNFLTRALRTRGVPVVCLDARDAKAALRVQINKTDANDAHGLAQVVRTGWFREVAIKSMDAHRCGCCWLLGHSWSRSARQLPIPYAAC
jgi:transposase